MGVLRVLITGGAGFIGSNLAQTLLSDGYDVVVYDNFSTGYRDNLRDLPVQVIQGDVRDKDSLDRAMQSVDSVVHLAALGSVPRSVANPLATHENNATGTLRTLEAARDADVAQVIVASSSSVYGRNPSLPKHESQVPMPASPYAVSKLATEQYALAFHHSYGMHTLAFRFFNVYGPRQRAGHAYAAVIPTFIDQILRSSPIRINGDGSTSRDFTFVGSVCSALAAAIAHGVTSPQPVNLAFGTRTTLNELANILEELSDRTVHREYGPPRVGDVPHSSADNSALRALLPGIEPTPLKTGLRATIDWFLASTGS